MTCFAVHTLLAAAGPGSTQPNPTAQMLQMLGTLVFFLFIMYLLMIRPQQKRAREHADLLKTLRPGDKVETSGGILGVVITVKEKSVSLRSADTKLEVLKSSIAAISERGSNDS